MVFLFVVQYCIVNVHGPGYNLLLQGSPILASSGASCFCELVKCNSGSDGVFKFGIGRTSLIEYITFLMGLSYGWGDGLMV